MLKLDRGSLAAIGCAAKEKMRYALNGLRITGREVIATDGRKLITVKHPDQGPDGADAVDFIPRIVERDGILSTLKTLSRKASDHEDRKVAHVRVRETNENGAVHASVPFGSTDRTEVTLKDIEGTFPEWADVMPRSDDFVAQVHLDGALLEDVLKVIAEVNKARTDGDMQTKGFTIKIGRTDCPVRIESRNGDVVAAIMPISVT